MEAVCTSETLVYSCETTRRYIPQDSQLHTRRCENLISHRVEPYWFNLIIPWQYSKPLVESLVKKNPSRRIGVTGHCYGMVRYKGPYALRHFLMCAPIWVLIIPDYTTRADKYQQKHLVSKQGVGDKSPWIVPTKYLCHTPQGSLTCRKILRRGANGFISPPKEVVLWAFIVLKIHRPRPGLNPRTLCPVASTKTLHHRGRRDRYWNARV
jgi:hypothetical protein